MNNSDSIESDDNSNDSNDNSNLNTTYDVNQYNNPIVTTTVMKSNNNYKMRINSNHKTPKSSFQSKILAVLKMKKVVAILGIICIINQSIMAKESDKAEPVIWLESKIAVSPTMVRFVLYLRWGNPCVKL